MLGGHGMGGMGRGHIQEGWDASGQGGACATKSGRCAAIWCGHDTLAWDGAHRGGLWGIWDGCSTLLGGPRARGVAMGLGCALGSWGTSVCRFGAWLGLWEAGVHVGKGCGGGGVGAGGAGCRETTTSTGTGGGGADTGLTALKADAGARVLAFDEGGWQLQACASFLAHVTVHLRR